MRDSHSSTSRELEEGQEQVRSLKEAVVELREQVDGAREAHALAVQEFDVRMNPVTEAPRGIYMLLAGSCSLNKRALFTVSERVV